MNLYVFLFFTLFILYGDLHAERIIQSLDTLRIDFHQFRGTGFSTDSTGGRLNSNLWMIQGLSDGNTQFGGSYISGDYARGLSNGRVSTGGVYAFRVNDTTKVLGFQSTGTDLAPGSVTLKVGIENLQGGSNIGIDFDIYFMNDQGRSSAIDLWWSVDTLQWVLLDNRFTTPTSADESPVWKQTRTNAIIDDLSITSIDTINFRWTMSDAGGTGSRDEWGLTNIAVFLTDKTGPTPPAPLFVLAKWDFDNETDTPDPISVDNADAQFGIFGARRSGYAAGISGRSANANQWNNPVNSFWYTRFSTIGYDSIHVNSWHYSSSTGPSKFILEWSKDSIMWQRALEDGLNIGSSFQQMSTSGIVLPDETSDTNQLWLRWLSSSNLAVNGQELGSAGTSRIDGITVEGRFIGSRLPFAPAPVLSLSGDDHFADIFIETTGTSIISSSLLQCNRTDIDSTFSIPITTTIRQQQRLMLPDLPQTSSWECFITLTSDVGVFVSDFSEIVVDPPPPPFAEKPDLPATDIRLLSRSDNSLRLIWTPGSGDSRIVLIKPTSHSVCLAQVSETYQYHPNPIYADTTYGGCQVVYNGSANAAQIVGLNPLQDVIVSVIEYNGESGREHYLNENAHAITFKTRSEPPESLKDFGVLQVIHNLAYLNWFKPTTGSIYVVAADSGWLAPDRLLAFESDEYQEFGTYGAVELCSNTTPCIINKDQVVGKILYGWVVDGPQGHRSHQSDMPSKLHIDWPNDESFTALASWSFNSEMMKADQHIWEYRESEIALIGARHRGFISGFEGRAVNSDQWDNGAGSKGWRITLSTLSLNKLTLSFRLLSSATGPAHFKLSCRVALTGQEYISSTTILSQSTWNLTGSQTVSVPDECLGYPRVDLLLLMESDISVNGNMVSRTGTSRIDDVLLSGQFGSFQDPILDIPLIIRNADNELVIQSNLVAGAGHVPIGRYLHLESDSGSIRVVLDPLRSSIVNSLIIGSKKATLYRAYHCIDIRVKNVCSAPVEFRTPYLIPPTPVFIDIVSNEPDSTVLVAYPSDKDYWVVVGDIYQSMPIAIDSVGVVKSNQSEWVHSERVSINNPFAISGLTPGNTYRMWAISVNGDSTAMRFSRPPHRYVDVKISDLIAPTEGVDNVRIVSLTLESVELDWNMTRTVPVLVSISEIGSSMEVPDQNTHYRANSLYGEGDLIHEYSFVVGNGILNSIRIDKLPLGRSWRLQIVPYFEQNGSITYATENASYFTFDTMPDPFANTTTARGIVQLADSTVVHVVGLVLFSTDDFGILHTNDGNIQIQWSSITSQSFMKGDSLAIRGQHIDGVVIADYVILLGNTTITDQPIAFTSDDSVFNAIQKKLIALGNVLAISPRHKSDTIFEQRGSIRRSIHLISSENELSVLNEESDTLVEFSIIGIPLVERSDTLLRVFIKDSQHIFAYPRVQILKESPNKYQELTWSTTTDSVTFAWKVDIGTRPFDVFPDSAFSSYNFLSRSVGDQSAIIRNQKMNSTQFQILANNLHTEHRGDDSLRTTVEIEWTIIPSEIAENGQSISSEGINAEWHSFQLIRLKAVSIDDHHDLPSEFSLSNPWPNPFNPTTTLRIDVPESGDLSVQVYDLTGRFVSQLRSGNVLAGVHTISWDAAKVASGIYVITTDYKNRRYSKLVTLIK